MIVDAEPDFLQARPQRKQRQPQAHDPTDNNMKSFTSERSADIEVSDAAQNSQVQPVQSAAPEPATPSPNKSEPFSRQQTEQEPECNAALPDNIKSESVCEQGTSALPVLPWLWQQAVDPDTGLWYYYRESSQVRYLHFSQQLDMEPGSSPQLGVISLKWPNSACTRQRLQP